MRLVPEMNAVKMHVCYTLHLINTVTGKNWVIAEALTALDQLD